MTDGDSGTISTDSAGRLSQGSDAIIRMADLLPHVVMDAPPARLADELDKLAENPYLHFEVAPYQGDALNYVVGKEDPVKLRETQKKNCLHFLDDVASRQQFGSCGSLSGRSG